MLPQTGSMISLKLRPRSDRQFSLGYKTIDPTDFHPEATRVVTSPALAGFVRISQFNDIENIPFILEGLTTGAVSWARKSSLPGLSHGARYRSGTTVIECSRQRQPQSVLQQLTTYSLA